MNPPYAPGVTGPTPNTSPFAKPQGANKSVASSIPPGMSYNQWMLMHAGDPNATQQYVQGNPNAYATTPQSQYDMNHNYTSPGPNRYPAAQPLTQSNPLTDLMQQLTGQLNQLNLSDYMTPRQTLVDTANAQINAQFDPQIESLLNSMEENKTRTARNKQDVGDLYNSLGQSFVDQLPQVQQRMAQAQQAVSDRYNASKQSLQDQYNQQSQKQQDVLKQLGIQAAAPDANKLLDADQAYLQGQQSLQNQQASNMLQEQQASEEQYTRGLGDNARMAGANAQTSLENKLADFLTQTEGQVGSMRGQKANALQALLGQMQTADYQQGQQNYQNAMKQLMDLAGFQFGVQKEQDQNDYNQQRLMLDLMGLQQKNGNSNDLFKLNTGMNGVANFLAQQYPTNPQTANNLANLVSGTLADPRVVAGNHMENGQSVQNNDEFLMNVLRELSTRNGPTAPGDLNNALDALLVAKGKYR